MNGPCCTLLLAGGHRIAVAGTVDEVTAKVHSGGWVMLDRVDGGDHGLDVHVNAGAVVAIKAGWHG